MSYLNCPACHLSLRAPRAAFMAPEHCPRCIGRRRVATPLFSSPLPMRQLVAEEAPPADRAASPIAALTRRAGARVTPPPPTPSLPDEDAPAGSA